MADGGQRHEHVPRDQGRAAGDDRGRGRIDRVHVVDLSHRRDAEGGGLQYVEGRLPHVRSLDRGRVSRPEHPLQRRLPGGSCARRTACARLPSSTSLASTCRMRPLPFNRVAFASRRRWRALRCFSRATRPASSTARISSSTTASPQCEPGSRRSGAYPHSLARSSAFLALNSSLVRNPASRSSPSFLIWSVIDSDAAGATEPPAGS